MNFRTMAAAAVLTVATVVPALAQGPGRGATVAAQDRAELGRTHHYRGTGFWPADAAAGIAGGAIGTAGAIAAAPFGQGPYAYNGYYADGQPYGFACQPGTRFRGDDGRVYICR